MSDRVHATTGTCWCGYVNGRIAERMNQTRSDTESEPAKPKGVFQR